MTANYSNHLFKLRHFRRLRVDETVITDFRENEFGNSGKFLLEKEGEKS
jgi:hypothetical protein